MRTLVKRKIQLAFPLNGIPAATNAIERTYCVEHLYEILGDRCWNTLTPTQYRQCSDGFSLLTVAGLHYYLPGYLISELDDPEEADVVAENWIYTLGGSSEFDRLRMLALGHLVTLDQLEAIALWLGHYVNVYDKSQYTTRAYETLEQWTSNAVDKK
jgi:hypothetical protein